MLAPFAPHLAERMYDNLGDVTTVHALDFPEADEALRDETLEERMEVLREAEEAAANARQQAERKLRWPVRRVVVEADDETRDALDALEDLFLDRVNAKELELLDEYDELTEVAEPQMGEIGPEFGEDAEKVMNAVRGEPREKVEDGVEVGGETVTLDAEMVEYRDETPENVEAAEFEDGTSTLTYPSTTRYALKDTPANSSAAFRRCVRNSTSTLSNASASRSTPTTNSSNSRCANVTTSSKRPVPTKSLTTWMLT